MGSGCCGGGSCGSSVQTITKEALKVQLGKVQVVNVLEPKWYELGFIKGSLKIPLSQLEQRAGELNKSQPVVTYCASYSCDSSTKAAQWLAAQGFDVRAYEGGIKEWTAAGLPVEGATAKAGAAAGSCGTSCC